MEIPEQYPPNKPNFAKVVLLSGIALFVLLVAAYFFLHHDAGRLMPAKPPTQAQVELPAQPAFAADTSYFAAPV